jgi:hypothetical protein
MDLVGRVYWKGWQSYFGLRIFAPPFGPPDHARCTSGLHDDPLIGGTEWLGEKGQCGLDEPDVRNCWVLRKTLIVYQFFEDRRFLSKIDRRSPLHQVRDLRR